MRTAALVVGLVTAVFLLFGGMLGACTGAVFDATEEVIGELDDSDGGVTSTTEDVLGAGIFAVFISFILFIGAGLAKAALKTSTILMILVFLGCLLLVAIDTTSAFSIVYYISIITTGICAGLMIVSYRRSRRSEP